MKKLNVNQMEQTQGGLNWCRLICVAIGIAVGNGAGAGIGIAVGEAIC